MSAYLYQVDEQSMHEILDDIENGYEVEHFPFRNHRDEVQIGDEIILMLTGAGEKAAAYLSYIVESEELEEHHPRSYRERERGRAPRPGFHARLNGFFPREVLRNEMRKHPAFDGFPFKSAHLQNPFVLSRAQEDAIYDIAETQLV